MKLGFRREEDKWIVSLIVDGKNVAERTISLEDIRQKKTIVLEY